VAYRNISGMSMQPADFRARPRKRKRRQAIIFRWAAFAFPAQLEASRHFAVSPLIGSLDAVAGGSP
jgi:hypothetical protein